MKKKLISILLLVVIFAALIPTAAFAEPAVVIYTLNTGDTVSSLCQRHGVDYNTYRVLIMALNNVSNENDFARMPVGSKIVIPVSANAAATISGIKTAGAAANTGSSAGTTGTDANSASAANAELGIAKNVVWGDTISCYVISYPIKAGDTVIGIYKTRNINYKTYSNLILKLNKISSVNNLRVGQTLLLPVDKVLPGDNVVYTIMNHPMKSGETVYGIISSGYGMNYRANTELLKTVNSKDNLGAFKVGEILHIAISGYIQNPAAPTATQAPAAGNTANAVVPNTSNGITVLN